ncbi:hypothetical protein PanWU01x14_224560, partial [Parasponia andersonii]
MASRQSEMWHCSAKWWRCSATKPRKRCSGITRMKSQCRSAVHMALRHHDINATMPQSHAPGTRALISGIVALGLWSF